MNQYFHYQQDQLFAENVALGDIAQRYGTPCYVYSRAALSDGYRQFAAAFKSREHLICYAVKANSNLAILNLFARLGAGFDIVSGGELQRVLAAGGAANKVVFSGVGKSEAEMRHGFGGGHPLLQRRVGSRAGPIERGGGQHGQGRADQPARESRCGCQDPSLHLHRPQTEQVRRGLHRGAGAVSQGSSHAAPARHRHGLPHRFAAHRGQPVHRGSGEGAGAGGSTGGRRHSSGASRSGRRPRYPLRRRDPPFHRGICASPAGCAARAFRKDHRRAGHGCWWAMPECC